MSEAKTKKVAGVDLSSACFAYVGDEKDTSTWKLPLFIPGNVSLTRNHVKNAIARFAETKGIPVIERATVWQMIAGAAKAQGISVQRETPEPAKSETVKPVQPDAEDADFKSALALGHLAAERFLEKLGYGGT